MKIFWNRKIQGVLVYCWFQTKENTYGCIFDLIDGKRERSWSIDPNDIKEINIGEIEANIASYMYGEMGKLLLKIRKKENEQE